MNSQNESSSTTVNCFIHSERAAMGFCVSCGKPICSECTVELDGKNNCKGCLVEMSKAARVTSQSKLQAEVGHASSQTRGKKQMVGVTGSALLFLGVFTPIISMPIVGSMNYFQNGKGDGIFIIGFSLLSFLLIFTKKFKGLWLTGLGSAGIMTFTFVNLQKSISQVQHELADNPFAGLANIQLQWGWAVLVIGAVLVIAAAIIKEPK